MSCSSCLRRRKSASHKVASHFSSRPKLVPHSFGHKSASHKIASCCMLVRAEVGVTLFFSGHKLGSHKVPYLALLIQAQVGVTLFLSGHKLASHKVPYLALLIQAQVGVTLLLSGSGHKSSTYKVACTPYPDPSWCRTPDRKGFAEAAPCGRDTPHVLSQVISFPAKQ